MNRSVSDGSLEIRGETSALCPSAAMGAWNSRAKKQQGPGKEQARSGVNVLLPPPGGLGFTELEASTKSLNLPLAPHMHVRSSHPQTYHGPGPRQRTSVAGDGMAEAMAMGEFERRLVFAKQVNKAPMPEVDVIP